MEYPVDRVRLARQPPIHPGIIFGDTVMPELRKDRTIAEIAALLGVSRATLHRVIAGAVAISVDMAVRIAKLCGGEPELWLDLQTDYDTFRARNVSPGNWNESRAFADLRRMVSLVPKEFFVSTTGWQQ